MADLVLLRTSSHAVGAVAPVTAEPRRGGRSGRPGSARKPTSRFVDDHVATRENEEGYEGERCLSSLPFFSAGGRCWLSSLPFFSVSSSLAFSSE